MIESATIRTKQSDLSFKPIQYNKAKYILLNMFDSLVNKPDEFNNPLEIADYSKNNVYVVDTKYYIE